MEIKIDNVIKLRDLCNCFIGESANLDEIEKAKQVTGFNVLGGGFCCIESPEGDKAITLAVHDAIEEVVSYYSDEIRKAIEEIYESVKGCCIEGDKGCCEEVGDVEEDTCEIIPLTKVRRLDTYNVECEMKDLARTYINKLAKTYINKGYTEIYANVIIQIMNVFIQYVCSRSTTRSETFSLLYQYKNGKTLDTFFGGSLIREQINNVINYIIERE